MCSNYQPVTRLDRLLTFFGVERDRDEPTADVFPLGMAPFIRATREGQEGGRPMAVVEDGMFGLLPYFATEIVFGRRTYNARSETVDRLPSFRQAWAAGQRCIVPAEAFYEPCWETGRAVRWRIGQPGDVPMGIAGLYRRWQNPGGGELFTFAMLTVNADHHPLMQRFHRPAEEKRMVVVVDPSRFLDWLTCSSSETARYFQPWGGSLVAVPAPLAKVPRSAAPPPPQNELF